MKPDKNRLDSDRPSHGRRLHKLAPFVLPFSHYAQKPCYELTVATRSDSVVCKVRSRLSRFRPRGQRPASYRQSLPRRTHREGCVLRSYLRLILTGINFALAIWQLPAIIWCSSAELAGDEAFRVDVSVCAVRYLRHCVCGSVAFCLGLKARANAGSRFCLANELCMRQRCRVSCVV